uniref:Uncharacterized protein n=1 Tax=Anguilla anguilla TaxID=7936 RepID=A0A0E9QQV9_ANGAN
MKQNYTNTDSRTEKSAQDRRDC